MSQEGGTGEIEVQTDQDHQELQDIPQENQNGTVGSRAGSAHSREADPKGLITDLTRLKEITQDDPEGNSSYRDMVQEFGEEQLPQTQDSDPMQQVFSEPNDTVFFGEGFEVVKESAEEGEEIEDVLDEDDNEFDLEGSDALFEDNDDENVSSMESDVDLYNASDYDTDLEDAKEPEKILFIDPYQNENTGKSVYLRKCDELGVTPATYFLKHMDDTHLVMKFHGLGPMGMRAMSGQLEINTVTEKIDLEGNFILSEGALYLTKVLRENVYVTELILCDNKIGNAGAKALCELLAENKTIIHLNLAGNDIEDQAASSFYEMLSRNGDIKTLILRHNLFEDGGAYWFSESMNENVTLETLDISFNRFTTKGCTLIASALKENVGLKYMNCSMNGFGVDGAKALGDSLKENKYLLDLNISYCRIPHEGAPFIAEGLQVNDTLHRLQIGSNPIQEDGGFQILEGVDKATQSVLRTLDFGNLMVRKKFQELHFKLHDERGLEVIYGDVLLDVVRTRLHGGFDPYSHFMNDPMTKLKNYVEKAGYRMVDLLKSFDRDQSFTISLDELKTGIRRCNIDLTDPQIVQLMNQLDKDGNGEIDFRYD
ncbi:hypothetical protein FSP39_024708 [Pinctada imbricata]|uniref:Uncharacterized protein n=1 Tax=Pinctada imbricata TaxID=66713 RepID=A0AA88Y4N6_PINIB|nr:hypothetical protein FSP39_024708 [Pinctada imbricata]